MGQLKYLDPASGDWLPATTVGPQGVTGPIGETGPQGPPSDELYVGTSAPTGPQTDIWYDPDATPPPPAQLVPYAPLQIKENGDFVGPWDLEGSSDTIFTGLVPGQLYLVMATCSAVATGNGMKYVDMAVDGTNTLALGHYFNVINTHLAFPTHTTTWRATLTEHTFGFRSGSGTPTGDANDRASIVLIPMAG